MDITITASQARSGTAKDYFESMDKDAALKIVRSLHAREVRHARGTAGTVMLGNLNRQGHALTIVRLGRVRGWLYRTFRADTLRDSKTALDALLGKAGLAQAVEREKADGIQESDAGRNCTMNGTPPRELTRRALREYLSTLLRHGGGFLDRESALREWGVNPHGARTIGVAGAARLEQLRGADGPMLARTPSKPELVQVLPSSQEGMGSAPPRASFTTQFVRSGAVAAMHVGDLVPNLAPPAWFCVAATPEGSAERVFHMLESGAKGLRALRDLVAAGSTVELVQTLADLSASGPTLASWLARQPRLNRYARQSLLNAAVRTLDGLFEQGAVHGSIRPENLYFDSQTGDFRLADVGTLTQLTSVSADPSLLDSERERGAPCFEEDLMGFGLTLLEVGLTLDGRRDVAAAVQDYRRGTDQAVHNGRAEGSTAWETIAATTVQSLEALLTRVPDNLKNDQMVAFGLACIEAGRGLSLPVADAPDPIGPARSALRSILQDERFKELGGALTDQIPRAQHGQLPPGFAYTYDPGVGQGSQIVDYEYDPELAGLLE